MSGSMGIPSGMLSPLALALLGMQQQQSAPLSSMAAVNPPSAVGLNGPNGLNPPATGQMPSWYTGNGNPFADSFFQPKEVSNLQFMQQMGAPMWAQSIAGNNGSGP